MAATVQAVLIFAENAIDIMFTRDHDNSSSLFLYPSSCWRVLHSLQIKPKILLGGTNLLKQII